jgi:hypothetical protein
MIGAAQADAGDAGVVVWLGGAIVDVASDADLVLAFELVEALLLALLSGIGQVQPDLFEQLLECAVNLTMSIGTAPASSS